MSAASLHHHICLICGCNTHQIINIYEPRSGPNIVELIQAKFKFQPLNEDKYLCFSCNNWLINWHSLQANNSNDAESPSGTFRSSQVNGGVAQQQQPHQFHQSHANIEESYASPQQQHQQQSHHLRQKAIQSSTAVCRPIAQVRPRQLTSDTGAQKPKPGPATIAEATLKPQLDQHIAPKKRSPYNYTKRTTYRQRRFSKKHLSHCSLCGRSIILYANTASRGLLKQLNRTPKRTAKCRKCRSVCQWRSIYMRSLTKEPKKPPTESAAAAPPSLVSQSVVVVEQSDGDGDGSTRTNQSQSQYLNRPLVDGKIVAMLRRLGTTLSREQQHAVNSHPPTLPPIMSPTKPRPRWTRPLEADEILLDFETAISEVLPIVESTKPRNATTQGEPEAETTRNKATTTRRKLTYQMSKCGSSDDGVKEVESEQHMTSSYQNLLVSMPKGLEISLI